MHSCAKEVCGEARCTRANLLGKWHQLCRNSERTCGPKAILDTTFGRDAMPQAATEIGSNWSTIPPVAPHLGGLWEAGIKAAKGHLRRMMGNTTFIFEELATVLSGIEAVLSSRPMVQVTDDPTDLTVITPGMLCGSRKVKYLPLSTPEPIATRIPTEFDHPQKRWAYILNLVSVFWRRWSREYLTTLQTRGKWRKENENLKVGDMVLLTDENTPPLHWPLGRIVAIFTGNDDICRAVKVRTAKGVYNRPVVKLRRLPIDPGPNDETNKVATSTSGARRA